MATGRHVLSSPGYSAGVQPGRADVGAPGVDNTGIRIWDLAERRLVDTSFAQPGSINSAAYSPDGSLFRTPTRIVRPRVGFQKTAACRRSLRPHRRCPFSGFQPQRKAHRHRQPGQNCARLGRWVRELVAELRGHAGPVDTVAFSADDRRVLTSSQDGTARIWSTGMADPVLELTESGVPRLSVDAGLVNS